MEVRNNNLQKSNFYQKWPNPCFLFAHDYMTLSRVSYVECVCIAAKSPKATNKVHSTAKA